MRRIVHAGVGFAGGVVAGLARAGDGKEPTPNDWRRAADIPEPMRPEVDNRSTRAGSAAMRFRIVSFNVHFGRSRDIGAVARALSSNDVLRSADVILLQEVESVPTEPAGRAARLARALGLNYAYAPVVRRGPAHTQGNAVLSRFPIHDLCVLRLKPLSIKFRQYPRAAMAVSLAVGPRPLRVFNVHLDTQVNLGRRIEQLRPVLRSAAADPADAVLIGGDVNTTPLLWYARIVPVAPFPQAARLDRYVRDFGFRTPLARLGHTHRTGMRLDAIYTRGLETVGAGVERAVRVSDHYPVWVDARRGS